MREITLIQAFGEVVRGFSNNMDESLDRLIEFLPHGSGIDGKTVLNYEETGITEEKSPSTVQKLVFDSEYHHMNSNGYYCGWFGFRITFLATFSGFDTEFEILWDNTDDHWFDEELEEGHPDNEPSKKNKICMKEMHEDHICESFIYAMEQKLAYTWNQEERKPEYSKI